MFRKLFLILIISLGTFCSVYADTPITDIHVRDVIIGGWGATNNFMNEFISPVSEFFFQPGAVGWSGLYSLFITIAFNLKNAFIAIAIVFLIIWVLTLLFSPGSEEDVAKWRKSILWVSLGVVIMQLAFSAWNTLILKNSLGQIGSSFGYEFWINVFAPLVKLLQMLAALGFIAMMFFAFYRRITASGDEEKLKKAKNSLIYAIIGFFLIKIPETFVSKIYGSPDCQAGWWLNFWSCEIKKQNLSEVVGIIAKIFNYFNTFLTILCVLMIVYAGWLVLISWGEEEKLKKAKNIILYILIGFVILVGSHAIFRFFILQG